MKKSKRNFKKGMAVILSLAMVTGLVPTMSGAVSTVQAAAGSGTKPSVSAYATKEQMMDGTFAPSSDGTATNIGKLVFGKNSSGDAQEWYILGKDDGVTGDNTILFAASPIATEKPFDSSNSSKRIDITTEENGVYETTDNFNTANDTIVNASHYGASDLRKALQAMAPGNSNTDYFTSAEQELMNSTTVTTKDTANNVTYTTTDKLYALAAEGADATTIKAGSDDSTLLAMSSYWSTGEKGFWLRSPYEKSVFIALLADPGGNVDCEGDFETKDIQPASNLNLSSVLFASAATAATSSDTAEQGTITDGTAMTLRLDGKEKKIGTAIYNTATGDIKVAKGSTTGDVALVVQGNDGTNDWYYSKKIDTTETETVNASTIKSTLSLSSDIDLSSCKIWLETTSADDGMTYAVSAEEEIEAINTTYATKEQLMKSFKPYSDGTATNIGKLVFGKNSSGGNQEWYILGKDDGVTGDNTILFAASPIATEKPFNSSTGTKTIYTTTDEYGVYKTTGSFTTSVSTTVNANHYGASDLRATLQGMATNSSYFTSSEQKLMNPTTVTTKDTANNVTYTTTDILYALMAEGYSGSYTTIKAGSNDSTVLAMSSYWNSGEWFWLRSPFDTYGYNVLCAYPGNFVHFDSISGKDAVQPASNLNLSSVLFASAAAASSSDTAVSGEISDGTAMTLRLDGTEKKIGTVTYNTATGDIRVAKGSTSGDVALVVQGNDGTNDWYYSKQITGTGTETVTLKQMNSALASSSLTVSDLSSCKIWLETTSTEDGMTYAVNAIEPTTISSVSITIDEPSLNTALDTEVACETKGVTTSPQITWTDEGSSPALGTAGYNTAYTASMTLTADIGYEFAENVTATVTTTSSNSVIATVTVNKNDDGTVTVTCTFPATAKDKLTSITTPQEITVANGTAYADMHLPTTVNIVTEGGTESSAAVQWDTTTPASGSYNPAVLTEQTVTLKGTVTCPETIDANGVSLATTITITVSAAGIVGAPTADIPAGTYTENQSVTLTSSTEGATIYYTTDGSEPTLTDGAPNGTTTEYTAPISVTGTEGQSIPTTIKAIAVKSGMQDSEVETFAYTIAIPVTKYTITASSGTNGTISTAGAVTVAAGEPATFTITAGGDDLTYQWQINRNDGKGWVDIEGAIAASYTTAATDASYNGNQYKCVITSNMGIVESEVITLTVDDTNNKDTDNKDTDGNAGSESREVKVTKISTKAYNHHLAVKHKLTLKTTVTPSNASNKGVTYTCSNTKYATVNKKGVVTAKKAGGGKTVIITVTAKDGSGVKATYEIKISKRAVTSIKVTAPKTAKAGSKVKLKSKVTPNKRVCTVVSYKCLTPEYASVSSKGVVKIRENAVGKTIKIRVKARDGSNKKKIVRIKITK